ncbi:hypothetical protein BC826DRAFT_1023384 [Russula brevipes]|nr:hypothetical protein BC826DRAFT_1023384 [Russula brevipes]
MSARRQASTTSLSRYARDGSPDPTARSLDFCNAFWGPSDAGVDVLFARMRGAARTMEELRTFWKERASIEEDYAKRLSKLAKMTLGRDEIGEFRNSVDTLRQETDKQASFHIQLAQQIRNELETPVVAFVARQSQHRKGYQAAIEKQFKTKQAQEVHVNKARERYEQDCLRINAYTAQSTLVQGKDLERISVKLERAQQTVHANEREYANFARALRDTVAKWEQEWKQFCDSCQDLEEERMEFTKDNVWVYANAVSIVCVSDDESCERLRLSLESFEPEKDQENFVRDYGTGNAMPDPPHFVNYSSAEGVPLTSSASRTTSRPAQFTRATQRANRLPAAPPQPDDEPFVNTAGVGSANRAPNDAAPVRTTSLSRGASTRRHVPVANGNANTNGPINGISPNSSPPANVPRQSGNAPSPLMINPAQQELGGENAYRVDHSKDQQASPRTLATASKVGDEMDPMVQAMETLRTAAGATVGRSTTRRVAVPDNNSGIGPSSSALPPHSLTPPVPVSPSNRNVDYRNSAEFVVGAPPAQGPSSRSTSPVPPNANFMQPPPQAPAPVVDAVIDSYHQSFPGERRSQSNSRRASFNAPQPQPQPQPAPAQSQGNHLERPLSREGHTGIGANGRSRSPSLNHPASRSTSPVPPGPVRGGSVNRLDQGAGPVQYRATTPNSVDVYRQQQHHQQQQQVVQARQIQQQQAPPPMQPPPPAPVQYQQPPVPPQHLQAPGGPAARPTQRQTSVSNPYVPPANWQTQAPAPPPQQYAPPPAQQPPTSQQSPAYAQPPHPYANAPPSQVYHQPPMGYGMQQSPVQQQQKQPTMQHGGTSSNGGDYYAPPQHQVYPQPPQQQRPPYQQPQHQQPQHQQPQHQQPQHQHAYGGGGYRSLSPGPVNRSPSPQPMALTQPQPQPLSEPPTRQYTEDGRGVLFYVRALYDYTATIPEEFDFQANDIIAVTATPEDGWWSGELLDENRRVPGRHIFPSNFVHLF